MTHDRLMRVSERWFRLLLRFFPPDFRDEMGSDVFEAYRNAQEDDYLEHGR